MRTAQRWSACPPCPAQHLYVLRTYASGSLFRQIRHSARHFGKKFARVHRQRHAAAQYSIPSFISVRYGTYNTSVSLLSRALISASILLSVLKTDLFITLVNIEHNLKLIYNVQLNRKRKKKLWNLKECLSSFVYFCVGTYICIVHVLKLGWLYLKAVDNLGIKKSRDPL